MTTDYRALAQPEPEGPMRVSSLEEEAVTWLPAHALPLPSSTSPNEAND